MMPVPTDCMLGSPLQTVQEMFQQGQGGEVGWQEKLAQAFRERLASEETWASVTSINEVENHQLREGQLVRFRCMVQV